MLKFTSVILSLAFFTSCNLTQSDKSNTPFDFSKLKIPEETQRKMESQFRTFQEQFTNLITQWQKGTRTEILNLKDKDPFHIVYTNAGFLYLTVDSIDKRQEGYHLKLKVGNPLAADFSDLKGKISWSAQQNQNTGSETSKDFTISELKSSTWTPLELDLMPLAEKNLENIRLEIKINQTKLLK